jgi:uncharacterized membrane protein
MRPANNSHKSQQGVITKDKAVFQSYEGLLPSPETLSKFESITPGFADRMLKMAEKELDHQQDIDNATIISFRQNAILGIVVAFLSVIIIAGLCFYAIYKGYPTAAASMFVGSAAAVVSAFLLQKKQNLNKS